MHSRAPGLAAWWLPDRTSAVFDARERAYGCIAKKATPARQPASRVAGLGLLRRFAANRRLPADGWGLARQLPKDDT